VTDNNAAEAAHKNQALRWLHAASMIGFVVGLLMCVAGAWMISAGIGTIATGIFVVVVAFAASERIDQKQKKTAQEVVEKTFSELQTEQ